MSDRKLKLISGTFEDGCGVVISHKDEYYHLIVKDGYVVVDGMKIPKDNWRKFARRIVEKGNKISVKDAKECGIPTGYFIEMCMRGLSEEQFIENAKTLLERLGE